MKRAIVFLFILGLLLGNAPQVYAKNNQRCNSQNFCTFWQGNPAIPRSIQGTITAFCTGSGITVDTGAGLVSVYGIGPWWYWDAQQMDRPKVGDTVSIDAQDVPLSTGVETFAIAITINDETIQLRDGTTGCPLWQGCRKWNK
ncbi:MAG: hypothetical protein WCQ99_14365 [Pseudomonadota bacterium]